MSFRAVYCDRPHGQQTGGLVMVLTYGKIARMSEPPILIRRVLIPHLA